MRFLGGLTLFFYTLVFFMVGGCDRLVARDRHRSTR